MILYHFTCGHAHKLIGRYNCLLIPQCSLWTVIWLTDQADPDFQATGLKPFGESSLKCDRTEHRYLVTDEKACRPWLGSPERAAKEASFVETLESWGDPEHWWITSEPVKAIWDRSYSEQRRMNA